jgi:hypothetical protein
MADFSYAPFTLPPEMAELVARLAQAWVEYPERPQPHPGVLSVWDELVENWAEDTSLPLFIRKHKDNRGSLIVHPSGRILVPVDNSPAQWAFGFAMLGRVPTLSDVRDLLTADAIPVAMMLKTVEKPLAHYKCTLRGVVTPNLLGWKVAHVQEVGLSTKEPLTAIHEVRLQQHFRWLVNPRNMFVVPKKYAALGELPEFRDAMRKLLKFGN